MTQPLASTRTQAAQAWAGVLHAAGPEAQDLGMSIFDVAHVIAQSRPLLAALTDPGRSDEAKSQLATNVFSEHVDSRVVELVGALTRARWAKPMSLVSTLHDLGIESVLCGARSQGTLNDVEHELFDVRDTIAAHHDLRVALDRSKRTTTESRVELAQRVFGEVISPIAMRLLVWCVRHKADGGVLTNLRRVYELAATMQDRVIADVISAIPLTVAQQERLENILRQRTGSEVELHLDVDPEVLGGMRITVNNTVIDGTISAALAQAKSSITK
ncbi:ATP synthase F1 subunit delta [Actinomyces vulturis]|uniref:ATP synthase F1 subunit delta n=1 Tax=Actinomyces vulturis TaxID=1857645 RepID=UPI00082E7F79|nr:ATP synthase F1 subunit delta [Actinomyces vulturis]